MIDLLSPCIFLKVMTLQFAVKHGILVVICSNMRKTENTRYAPRRSAPVQARSAAEQGIVVSGGGGPEPGKPRESTETPWESTETCQEPAVLTRESS